MHYITDTDIMLNWGERGCLNSWITEYSHEKNDYFLNYRIMWNEISGEVYRYKIGSVEIDIPADIYVMIGDVYGSLDWVSSEEMINRSVDLVVLDPEFKTWTLKTPEFIGVVDKTVYWPRTKNIIPLVADNNVLILSEKDVYSKTQDMNILDLLV